VTKPGKIAAGVGVAAVTCALLAARTSGIARVWWVWTAIACTIASAAYVANRPGWLGKRAGTFAWRALALAPYLVAFRVACMIMRWWRPPDTPSPVAPGLWVAGRIGLEALPARVVYVVDLVAEYPAPRALRALPGYRSLPVLDGGYPSDTRQFLALVEELCRADGDVLVHCDSGRGRAPTMAAALLIARGLAPDAGAALARVRSCRSVAAPTRSDVTFLTATTPALRALARRRDGAGSRRDSVAW
jgi:protein-tyrosine phosphatase